MNKIYCFINSSSAIGLYVLALADDGHHLASHCSTTEGWAKHDIGINSNWQHENYKAHFPNGYELEWIDEDDLKGHEAFQKAVELNNKLPDSEALDLAACRHQSTAIHSPKGTEAEGGIYLGILTEEELNKFEALNKRFVNSQTVEVLINSIRAIQERNRNLVLENDELNAENQKYKALVTAVLNAHRERGAIMTEACGDREAVSIAYELEETK